MEQSWAPSWALPQAPLSRSETSPASFPAAKTLLRNCLYSTKFWNLLSAEPCLQEKSAKKAQWLELVPTSKAQLLVYFISILMYRHPQMPERHWDILFVLHLLYPIQYLWKYPHVTLLRVLVYFGASKGFPMLGLGAGCQMWQECGGKKSSFT